MGSVTPLGVKRAGPGLLFSPLMEYFRVRAVWPTSREACTGNNLATGFLSKALEEMKDLLVSYFIRSRV